MVSKFEQYKAAKTRLAEAVEWVEMIGKPQPRTTAKADGYLCKFVVDAQVHFQPSDGANNYHDPNGTLEAAINAEAKKRAPEILAAALEVMRNNVRQLRKEAADEYAELLRSED